MLLDHTKAVAGFARCHTHHPDPLSHGTRQAQR
jgi:hypothetical protein